MRQVFLQTMALVGLFLAGRWIYSACASDETQIRWMIESMADGFNATRANPCLDGLAAGYVDTTSGADRELVHSALVHLFFTAKDETTKKFLYAVEMPEDELKISVSESDPPTATVDALARFHEVHGGERTPAWEIRFHGELAEGEGDWEFVRTQHETVSGRRPK